MGCRQLPRCVAKLDQVRILFERTRKFSTCFFEKTRVIRYQLMCLNRLIDAEKKSSEHNEEQRRPRVMLALQQGVMAMQALTPSPTLRHVFVLTSPQHSAAAWHYLVSFALANDTQDSKAVAELLQDAVITVPRCLALRLMSARRRPSPQCLHFTNFHSGFATF